MNEGCVHEIRRGGGNPRSIALEPGVALEPWSIGLVADWRIEADSVVDVHAFVYFDGTTLYVQSADANDPVRINGKPVGTSWTPLAPPSTLALGDARLVYCPASQASVSANGPASARPAAGAPPAATYDDDAPTVVGSHGPSARAGRARRDDDENTSDIPLPTGPAPVVAPEEDNETTRALPVPDIAMGMVPRAAAPFAPPPAAAMGGPPLGALTVPAGPPPAAAPGPLAAPPPVAIAEPKPTALDQIKAQWREASLPKKAILFLLPVAFVMVIFGLDDDPPKKLAPKPAPSTTAAQAAKPSSSEPGDDKGDGEPTKPKPPASAEPDEPPQGKGPKPPATAAPSTSASSKVVASNPSTAGSAKTAERLAVDAVAAGAWEPAAKMYEDLAAEHPDVPAYKHAARILRAKTKK